MRWRWLVFLSLPCLLGACAPAHGWLPVLDLRAGAQRRLAASGDRDHAAWHGTVLVTARWRRRRGVAVRPTLEATGAPSLQAAPYPPCPIAGLCAWERRARARALAALDPGGG